MKPTTYIGVFGALAVATIVEVLVAREPLARVAMVVAIMLLAALQGLLIAMYYMHLRYEGRFLAAVAVPPLLIVLTLLIALGIT